MEIRHLFNSPPLLIKTHHDHSAYLHQSLTSESSHAAVWLSLVLLWPHPQVHVCTGRQSCLPFCSWPQGEVATDSTGAQRDAGKGPTGFASGETYFWCHSLGVALKVGLFFFNFWNLHWYCLVCLSSHGRQSQLHGNDLSGDGVRQRGKRAWKGGLAKWEEKQVCHTCPPRTCFSLLCL